MQERYQESSCNRENEISDIKVKVKLLEKDIEVVHVISSKLSDSIEKIQEMNMNLVKMISLHDQKHNQHEKEEDELKGEVKELHSRITTVNREITDRIDQVERHIASRIDALRADLLVHKKEDEEKRVDPGLMKKISDIEQWRWMLIGAIAVSAWIIGEANLIGKLLK